MALDREPQEAEQGSGRGTLWAVLKCAAVAAILAWLVGSGRLQLSKLGNLHRNWQWLAYGLLLLLPGYFLCSLRYYLLLREFEVPCSLRQAFHLTMMGSFFDVASPLHGDIVRAYYLGRETGKGYRSLAVLSVIADRFVGLFALFLFALLACAAAYKEIQGTPLLLHVWRMLLAVCATGVVGFWVLTAQAVEKSNWRRALMKRLPLHDRFERIYVAIIGLRRRPGILAAILGLSLVNHLISCLSILCLARALAFTSFPENLPAALEILPSLVVLPLAMFLNMFGPGGGIGAGEAAFEWLFRVMLRVNEGAELAMVFHIVLLFSRALCFPFVLLYRRRGPPRASSEGEGAAAAAEGGDSPFSPLPLGGEGRVRGR